MLRSHDLSCLSVSGRVWRPPGWLLDVFGSATSSSWRILEALGGFRSMQNQDSSALSVSGRLTTHDLSCLSVSGGFPECSEVTIYRACRCLGGFGGLPDGFLTCSGAPQAPLGGSWKLLGAFGACKIKIHRPCRCLGGSQLTICRACRCLEASRNAPKSRSIVPVGVWEGLEASRMAS